MLIDKILKLLGSEAILQDKEICRILEAKYYMLNESNPNLDLSDSDELFFRHASWLLDSQDRVRGVVKRSLV